MHYIIYMHPSKDSFNGQVLHTFEQALKQKGNEEVYVKHLYESFTDVVLSETEYEDTLKGVYADDVQREHQMLQAAKTITLIFPIWWGGFPAIGKGYLDRVLSYGFAFELENETPIPKMNNKPLGLIYTTGSPETEWNKAEKDHFEGIVKHSISDFCGFDLLKPLHLGYVVQASEKEHQTMLQRVSDYAEHYE
ncbi:NAD(P)H-dependent oxidoreductase [Geomicrobium sediminis]|uniref:NAD(P)H dehydrogenase (Quinone) n=1 Tax=Geomicrobium sediminis TaxID=1347788 RepID=A0ABS2P832_9BACL|nr:NAD(P)H-dependent oxidoreductase [Geomicrobium sediminis]MBM7631579.1 NAD(P)H dehydrogenase (quinone) [Geomicrobium sediminis]